MWLSLAIKYPILWTQVQFSYIFAFTYYILVLCWVHAVLQQDPAYYVLKEDESPCIFGSIEKQRWSYACAKQLIERLIFGKAISSTELADFKILGTNSSDWLWVCWQLRVQRMALNLPLWGPSTGLDPGWISFQGLMVQVRVFQEFLHALVM